MSSFDASWQKVQLGDHVDLLTGFPFKSKLYTEDASDVRLLRGDNVGQGYLRWDGAKRWPVGEYDDFEKFQLREGDVILAMDRPWIAAGLKYAWVKQSELPALLVQRVARMRGVNGLRTDYLRYLIGSQEFTDHVLSIITGVNVPHISGRDIKAFRCFLPPPAVQVRVASILSAYDDLIENNTRRIAILEEMARRLYEEWFVHFRFPGNEEVRVVESEIGEVPKGWEIKRVDQIANVIRGRSYRRTELVDEGGLPFINLKCINRDGGFRRDGLKRYSGKFKPAQVVRTGDIVMAVTDMTQERRIVARIGRVPSLAEGQGIISMDVVKIEPREGVQTDFLYAFFRWSPFSEEVKAYANGANVLHLNPAMISEYRLAYPPTELRHHFVQVASPQFQSIDMLERKNTNLRAQRDLLLPKLISGEIDVSEVQAPLEEVEAA